MGTCTGISPYIDDIVEGVVRLLPHIPKQDENGAAYKIYNIGNNQPEKLMDFIEILEDAIGKRAEKEFLPMQPGDVYQTYADVTDLMADVGFQTGDQPQTGDWAVYGLV